MQLGMKKHIIVRSIIVLGILLGIVRLALLFGSRPDAKVPGQYETLDQAAALYPDYTDVTIPPNIAPLNFLVSDSSAMAYVARFAGEAGHEILVGADACGLIQLDTLQWREMLQASKGADITVSIFAKKPGGWVMYKPHVLSVAREDIDPFLSYRLIEPGYELYRQLGIYQRDLTSFVERPIYENNREYADGENHCINCHNYRNYSAANMVFHVRSRSSACEDTSMATTSHCASRMVANVRCRSGDSGVVCSAFSRLPAISMPTVPMTPVRLPCARAICSTR